MRTLIRGGTVVTATETTEADVVIEDEKVSAIGRGMAVEARPRDRRDRPLRDARRRRRAHAHGTAVRRQLLLGRLRDGDRAAAFGGTTTIVDFALQDYGEGLRQGLDRWFAKAQNAVTDYGFHMIMREVNDQVLKEMDELVGEGVTSFKLFMAYPGVFMLDDASIFRAMRQAGESGALIMMHAENGGPIDVLVRQFLDGGQDRAREPRAHPARRHGGRGRPSRVQLAELAERPAYIVHLSSRDALNALAGGARPRAAAFAETCPQYLYLPGRHGETRVRGREVRLLAAAAHRRPPRGPVAGLQRGRPPVVVHRPRPVQHNGQKDLGQGRLLEDPERPAVGRGPVHLLYGGVEAGHIDLNRFVELVATAPAKMFGLYPRKGTIAAGSDADIVVFDPKKDGRSRASTHHMRVDYSPTRAVSSAVCPRS